MEANRESVLAARARWLDGAGASGASSVANARASAAPTSAAPTSAALTSPAPTSAESEPTALAAPSAPPPVVQVEVIEEALELLRGINNKLVLIYEKVNVTAPAGAPAVDPPQPVSEAVALRAPLVVPPAAPRSDVDMFDYGNMVDDYVDPKLRCGVCHGSSADRLIALIPCGHYPYCGDCVKNLLAAKASMPIWERGPEFSTFKLTCPQCQVKAKQTLDLLLDGPQD